MRTKFLFALLFCLLAAQARSQSVGLVLSGGGAKGLYHIGVIKALEENNIPIDYISGTSMGSIIGGLYAIGMTPDEIRDTFVSPQVTYWLSGKIEDRYKYYFKQMHVDAAMFTLRYDPSDASKEKKRPGGISSSLVPSNQLDLAFIEFFSAATVECGGDFDKLLVPFRCIATDAVNKREVIHRRGDLGKAIRTSMTIPLVFKPIASDSTVLYDGGLFNNFPWQVLESDFEPDILIGSRCVEDKISPENTSLMDQMFTLTMLHTDYDLPEDKGILIDRIFTGVSMLDFTKASQIIQTGYEDAIAKMDQIKARIQRRTDAQTLAEKRAKFTRNEPKLLFENYTITGLNQKQEGYVRKLLKINEPPYSIDEFRKEYFKILSEGEIDGDYPEVAYNPQTGLFDLSMKMQTKPSFKLKFGGNISSTALNQAYIGLEYRNMGKSAHAYNLDGYFSPFYVSTALSARTDFFLGSPFFYELGLSYNHYNYFRSDYGGITRTNDLSYAKYEDSYLKAIFGMPVGRHTVLTLQGNAAIDNYKYASSSKVYEKGDLLDRTNFDFLSAKLELERNNINFYLYPTRGIYQSLSTIAVTGREKFYPAEKGYVATTKANHYWLGAQYVREEYFDVPEVKWFSFGYYLNLTLTNHPTFLNANATNITSPAFTPTPHSKIVYMKEFRASSFLGGGLTPTFEFTPNIYLRTSAYAFLPDNFEGEKMDAKSRLRYMFDTSLVYQTLIGPVSLSLSKYDTSRNNWFITFNFGLAIFNKKALFY